MNEWVNSEWMKYFAVCDVMTKIDDGDDDSDDDDDDDDDNSDDGEVECKLTRKYKMHSIINCACVRRADSEIKYAMLT